MFSTHHLKKLYSNFSLPIRKLIDFSFHIRIQIYIDGENELAQHVLYLYLSRLLWI